MVRKKLRKLLSDPPPWAKAVFIMAGVFLLAFGGTLLFVAASPLPDLETLSTRKISESTRIMDRTGEIVLHDLNPDVTRNIVPLENISPNIREATIAIEDSAFYYHSGISIPAIARAIFVDAKIFLGLSQGYTQGGSTITQQVVKNTLLTNDRTIVRKIHEWVLALKLEQNYSKDEILELYFNNTPYGGTLYGIEAATRAYFGKSAKEVSIAEAAYLAALPQAPTYYSPYGNNRDALDARKDAVLARMRLLGYITEDELQAARSEEVAFSPSRENSIIAPHFVFFIEQILEEKYGPTAVSRGLTVTTTLDAELQHEAEVIVNKHALENETRFNTENAALVAIDPQTGHILSMVGSRDYFDENIDGNYNIAVAERQPGSSFKPFVYAAALAKGFTPETIIFDLPTQFSTACQPSDIFKSEYPCYAPGNYDGTFRGPMTLLGALAQSINIPAVKVMYLAGVDNVIDLAGRMGITTLGDVKQYGLSLALGAGEVRLLDLVSAYGVFAAEGKRHPPTGILKVEDGNGKVLEEWKEEPEEVLDPGVARDISYMLSNNEARQPAYRPDNPFNIPGYDVAAKTGTTNDSKDFWVVGYTPSIVVGVWAGNNDPGKPTVREIAGYVVSPMWREFMDYALTKVPQGYFAERRAIPDNAPPALRGSYSGRDGIHDILYWVDKDNPLGGGTSRFDAQFRYWEFPLTANLAEQREEQDRENRRNDNEETDEEEQAILQEIMPPGFGN